MRGLWRPKGTFRCIAKSASRAKSDYFTMPRDYCLSRRMSCSARRGDETITVLALRVMQVWVRLRKLLVDGISLME
jgi:hypothetical protein